MASATMTGQSDEFLSIIIKEEHEELNSDDAEENCFLQETNNISNEREKYIVNSINIEDNNGYGIICSDQIILNNFKEEDRCNESSAELECNAGKEMYDNVFIKYEINDGLHSALIINKGMKEEELCSNDGLTSTNNILNESIKSKEENELNSDFIFSSLGEGCRSAETIVNLIEDESKPFNSILSGADKKKLTRKIMSGSNETDKNEFQNPLDNTKINGISDSDGEYEPYKYLFKQEKKIDLYRTDNVNEAKKLFKCTKCYKTFTQRANLKRHTMIHTGEKPFKCDKCEKSFTESAYLKIHTLFHTGEKPFKCDQCEKSFTTGGNLKEHTMIHTREKSFKCDICEKSFNQRRSLKRHVMIHNEEKPFKCDICKKSFIQIGHFKQHTLIHTGEKPFKCDMCEKSFTMKDSLKKHYISHTGDQHYKCDKCEKTFNVISNLRKHALIHSEEKPHKCNKCDNRFKRRQHLKRHYRTHDKS